MKSDTSNRILWIDSLKGFCIIFVVLGHALLGYLQKQTYPDCAGMFQLAKDWIYTWHMPLFFVLSGITFRLSCLKENRLNTQKLRRSTLNLLIIYLIFATALPLLKIVFSAFVNNTVHPSQVIRLILLPTTPMWYIWVLIIYDWVFAAIHYAVGQGGNKRRLAALMLLLAAVALTGNIFYQTGVLVIVCLRNMLKCGLFFAAGIYFNEIKSILLSKASLAASAIIAGASAFYMVCTYLITPYRSLLINSVFISLLNTASLCVLLIALFSSVKRAGENQLLIFLGINSLFIYLLHTYFVTAMRVIAVKLHIGIASIGLLAATLIPLAICSAAAVAVPHIPMVRALFRPMEAIDRIKAKKAAYPNG